MKINLNKLLFIIAVFLFIPLTTQAGVWEQSTQADFERGTTQGDMEIRDGEIRLISGTVYENAEDGNTDGWSIFDNDPPGEIRNILDEDSRNRVIELDNGIRGNHLTGYKYGNPIRGPSNMRWDVKSNATFRFYIVLNTPEGTRVLSYSPSFINSRSGMYLRHELPDTIYDENWHTIDRNLTEDLHRFEPDNEITSIRYISARGNVRIDNVEFLPNESIYTSPTLDLGENRVASLNRIIWEEEVPTDTSLTLQTRTSANNSVWSEWSREYDSSAGERITSTPQRYFQYRVNLNNNSNITAIPRLRRALVEYNKVPNAPENLSPANDRRLTNKNNLTWNAASDPDPEDSVTYTLELDNNSTFESLNSVTSRIEGTEINISRLENFTSLQDDTRYYWRIKTVDSQNNQSSYSVGEKYFILDKENRVPSSPTTGFNPYQGGVVKTQKPTLYWDEASDPDLADSAETLSYILQVDENNRFNSANVYNVDTNRTSFTIPEDLEDNTNYFYRIKTKDDEGAESSWSSVQNFVVATGKNPIISVSKTVGINANNDKQSSIFLGFLSSNINNLKDLEYFYWLAIILAIIVIFFLLNRNILVNYILAPAFHKKSFKNKQKNYILFSKNTKSSSSAKKVATEVKGSRTKTVVAILIIIGIIALTLAGIYYYKDNPSPYKDDGKNIEIGNTLIYRIDFKNEGESSASNFNIMDNIPEGTSYIENSVTINGDSKTDARDDDLVTLNSNNIKFELEEILPKTSGYVTFKVKVVSVPENHKVSNSADIVFSESDGVQNTNQVTNYIEGDTTAASAIKGAVWDDNNNNKIKDENEQGLEGIKIKLYKDKNNNNSLDVEDNSFIAEQNSDSNGNYEFRNITSGNYFVQIDEETLPEESSITTENNPQLVNLEGGQEYSDINFGIGSQLAEDGSGPKGKIGNLVWKDNNNNSAKDADEAGLENISVKLFEDSNNNSQLEFDQDLFVTLNKTNSNGNYEFTGLSPRDYLVLVEESTLPNDYKLTTSENPIFVKLESDDQEYSDANFGYNTEGKVDDSEGGVVSSEDYNGTPQIITSDQENRADTISVTPIEVSEEAKKGKITPPVLTHLGSAQIGNYDAKYSMPVDEDLVLKGKTGPNFTVTLFIHSDLNLKTVTSANQDGLWEMIVNTKLFETGEHRIYAQSQDMEGNLSEKVEIAKFKINKGKKAGEQFNYWIALLGLIVIAATIIATTWIKERSRNPKSNTSPKLKTKPKAKKIVNKRPKKKIRIT